MDTHHSLIYRLVSKFLIESAEGNEALSSPTGVFPALDGLSGTLCIDDSFMTKSSREIDHIHIIR